VHFAETGHPLVGDEVYGGRRARHVKFPRPALHAWRLGLTHPTKDEWMEFEAPLAEDLVELIERFRK
jgi:23S rRNA pseudouridine1911/1915/1917 synthase